MMFFCRKNVHVKIEKVVKIKILPLVQVLEEISLPHLKTIAIKMENNVVKNEVVCSCK